MIKLHKATQTDFNNNGEAILDNIVTECIVEQRINDSYFLNATFIKDEFGVCDLLEEEKILTVPTPQGEQAFRIVDIKPIGDYTLSVFARHIFFDLNRRVVKRMKIEQSNGAFTLNKLKISLDKEVPHTFTSNISKNASLDWWFKKGVEALLGSEENSFLNKYGGELWVNNWNVAINTKIGTDRGFTAQYRKNITGFQGTISTDKMITRIVPKGFDGITLENNAHVDSSLINNYNEIYTEVVEFTDIKWKDSPNNSGDEGFDTLAEAQAELVKACGEYFTDTQCDVPSATFTVNILDLKDTLEYKDVALFESIMLGDVVHIDYTPFNIKMSKRLEYYSYDSLKQAYEVLELGQSQDNYIREVTQSINKKPNQDDINNQLQDIIDNAFKDINDAITGGGNNSYIRFLPTFTNPKEILALDNEDMSKAVNVVRINQSGIGLSTTGVNGTYQGITSNGKLAISEVTAHQITANLIRLGILSDVAGKSWLNLDNGTFSYANGKIAFDGSNLNINANSIKVNSEDVTTLGTVRSEINQKADEINLSVKNSGLSNEVRNSKFAKGLNYWTINSSPTAEVIYGDVNYLKLTTHGNNQYIKQTMKFEANKKYTLQAYVTVETGVEVGIQCYCNGQWYSTKTTTNGIITLQVTSNSNQDAEIQLGRGSWGTNGISRWLWCYCIAGDYIKGWLPHAEEIYSSNVKLDSQSFEVAFSNGTKMTCDVNTPLTLIDGSTNYQYHALSERGKIVLGGVAGVFPKEAWVQLPDIFKGKKFRVSSSVSQTAGGSSVAEWVARIEQDVIEYDYPNAKFKIKGYWTSRTDQDEVYEKELDISWIAIA